MRRHLPVAPGPIPPPPPRPASSVSITVAVECGICRHQYPVQLKPGGRHYLECPKCNNKSHQVLLG